jgi:hypothetical protein
VGGGGGGSGVSASGSGSGRRRPRGDSDVESVGSRRGSKVCRLFIFLYFYCLAYNNGLFLAPPSLRAPWRDV